SDAFSLEMNGGVMAVVDDDHTAVADDHTAVADDHTAVVDDHTAVVDDHTAVVDDDHTALVLDVGDRGDAGLDLGHHAGGRHGPIQGQALFQSSSGRADLPSLIHGFSLLQSGSA